MMALYVFGLVLGGGFLAISLFGDLLGGHGDVDLVSDGLSDLDPGHDHAAGGDHDGAATKIFSMRTVTYSLFGFGAVGALLTWLWSGGAPVTIAVLAAGTGVASGAMVNVVFSWMSRSESGALEGEDAFEGLTGRVTLPIAASGGHIRVEKAGREVELRALPHPSASDRGDPAGWRRVVVVEMEHGVARVAPLDNDQLLQP